VKIRDPKTKASYTKRQWNLIRSLAPAREIEYHRRNFMSLAFILLNLGLPLTPGGQRPSVPNSSEDSWEKLWIPSTKEIPRLMKR
jgi:hypothetical protein